MKSNSQYIISVNKQYVQHTNSYGGRAYPPSYDSLAIFLAHFADTHAGSSKSIANILSAIRVFCYYSHQPWLPADQLYRLSLVRKEIRLEDAKPINRKLPIKRELIQRGLARHWKVTESACDLLVATITLFGHNGVLRGDEIFSKIRVGDVTWDHGSAIRSFKVHIGRPDQPGKTAKDGGGFIVHIVDYKGASAYKYLRAWFDLHGLWTRPLCYIFPNAAISGKDKTVVFQFNQCISKKWYERRLDAMLTSVGEDPTLYSVHSLRAGGATELFLSGASMAVVQIYGRWKSESALIYFRDASGIVAYAAAKAFETGVFSCIGGY